jgi:hypothetical protein
MKCPYTWVKASDTGSEAFLIPCGRCGACRHNRRSQWTFRLIQEAKDHTYKWFTTLTYDEDHVPYNEIVDEHGEIHQVHTLRKRDLQLFIKRLRKNQDAYCKANDLPQHKIRYYAVGEYGSNTFRPHYHLILFNVLPRVIHDQTIWGKGFTKTYPLEDGAMHYVTKYHVNKHQSDENDPYDPEFALMSRRPGIGANYLQSNKARHIFGELTYIQNGKFKQSMPSYYKEKIWTEEERKLMRPELIIEADKAYWKEYDRLEALDIKNPHAYMKMSQIYHEQQVKHKAQQKDKL